EGAVAQDDQGVGGGAAARHLVAGPLQALADEQGDVVVVLDQEQPQHVGHRSPSSARAPSAESPMVTMTAQPRPGPEAARRVPPPPVSAGRPGTSPSGAAGGGLPPANGSNSCSVRSGDRPPPSSDPHHSSPPGVRRAPTSTRKGRSAAAFCAAWRSSST